MKKGKKKALKIKFRVEKDYQECARVTEKLHREGVEEKELILA